MNPSLESDSDADTAAAGNDETDAEQAKAKKPTTQKMPVVRLNSGREVVAEPEEWIIEDETGDVLASYLQVPL